MSDDPQTIDVRELLAKLADLFSAFEADVARTSPQVEGEHVTPARAAMEAGAESVPVAAFRDVLSVADNAVALVCSAAPFLRDVSRVLGGGHIVMRKGQPSPAPRVGDCIVGLTADGWVALRADEDLDWISSAGHIYRPDEILHFAELPAVSGKGRV